jgi:copper chaperone CopZ
MKTVEMTVVGMDCAGCVTKIETGLKGLPGVLDAKVSLDTGKAVVEIDPEIIGDDILRETVADLGYEVST